MNVLSQCLKLRQYPKNMIVSRKQAMEILDSFYTEWDVNPSSFFDLNKYAAYFYAYYNTRSGDHKKCFIMIEKN